MGVLTEKQVFIGLKDAFTDEEARQAKTWTKETFDTFITRHRTRSEIQWLLQRSDSQSICDIALSLAKTGVFISSHPINTAPENHTMPSILKITAPSQQPPNPTPSQPQPPSPAPPFPIISLPLPTQVLILRHSQLLLETSCHAFASHHLPQILRQKGWDCPEAVELNIWSNFFLTHKPHILPPNLSPTPDGKKLSAAQVLKSLAEIRHSAVHRHRLSAEALLKLLGDAEIFAQSALGDAEAKGELGRMREGVEEAVGRIKKEREALEIRARKVAELFAERRRVIEREERDVMEGIWEEERGLREGVGGELRGWVLEGEGKVGEKVGEQKGSGKGKQESGEREEDGEEFFDAQEEFDMDRGLVACKDGCDAYRTDQV